MAGMPERNEQFSAPAWLRDLGFSSWLLVGFVLIVIGVIWLLGQTSTIVMPVLLAAVHIGDELRRSSDAGVAEVAPVPSG
jgi:hypothetical protein